MTQPIDRETAIALAKEAGMAGMLTDVVCSLEEIHRLCNLAIAHSRKDAEPVFCKVLPELPKPSKFRRQTRKDGGIDMVPAYTDEEMYKYGEACIAEHPPEADKLLQQALEAFDAILYWRKGDVSTERTVESIRTYLENKNA